MFFNHLRWH